MKTRVIGACLLTLSTLSAALIRSQVESAVAAQRSIATQLDLSSSSGVMWAQRNISTFVLTVLTTQSTAFGPRSYSQESYVQDTALAIAAGGYNLFTTSSSTQAYGGSGSSLGLGVGFSFSDDGPGSSYWAPGALLAEWNPIPVVTVADRGIPAVDNYPHDFSPGSLLVGPGDDSQFTPPHLLLAGANQAPPPTLNPLGLALRGVSPEVFGGSPSTVRSAPVAAVIPTAEVATAERTTTSAPVVLFAPTASGSDPVAAKDPAAAPQTQTPVASVSSTAPQSIATVAEAFMTTTVTSTNLSPAARTLLGAESPLIGNAANLNNSPEPGSIVAMGLGLSLVAWKLQRRTQKRAEADVDLQAN